MLSELEFRMDIDLILSELEFRMDQLRCQHLLSLRESMQNACRIYSGLGPQPLYNLFAVNEYGFTPFANAWMSKSTTVNKNGFTSFC